MPQPVLLKNLKLNGIMKTYRTSLVVQMVKCPPTMWETWVQSLGWEDHLEKGNGNPLQYSCQENPMDGGTW